MAAGVALRAPETLGITAAEWLQMGRAWGAEGPTEVQLLLFAAFAYVDVPRGRPLEGWASFGFETEPQTHFFSDDPYQCFALQTGHDLVLGFRGTELPALQPKLRDLLGVRQSVRDWGTNFLMGLTQLPQGRVHTGFHMAITALWKELKVRLLQFWRESPHGRIYVTGHSQGAALAVMATLLLLQEDWHPSPIYLAAFAPPLVGDEALVFWMERKAAERGNVGLVRYSNRHDPVPLLPPSTSLTPYFPGPGKHVHLGHDPHLPSSDEDRFVSSGGLDAFYAAHLLGQVSLFQFLRHFLVNATFHFPAGLPLILGQPHTRPGYIALLRAQPPPFN